MSNTLGMLTWEIDDNQQRIEERFKESNLDGKASFYLSKFQEGSFGVEVSPLIS